MSKVYRLWSSDARSMTVGRVGHHDRALERMFMMIRRSALPERMSYRHMVRSVPTDARTLVSLWLKRTAVTVSMDEPNWRVESGLERFSSQICTVLEAVAKTASLRWWSMPLKPFLDV